MTKNLRRKLLRDLRQNFVQFLAIFVMCFLAMFILVTLDSDITGLGHATDEYYKETNFMDLSMTSEGFSPEDLITIKSVPVVKDAEFRYTTVGRITVDGAEKKLEYNFIDSNNITSMLLFEGVPYESGMNGIWIDRNFAAKERISVGDSVQLKCDGIEFAETVRGIMDSPDHLYFMIDDTYLQPEYGAYGFAYLDSGEYPGETINFDTAYIDLNTVDDQFYMTEEDERLIDEARLAITEVISKSFLSFTPKNKEGGFYSMNEDMESYTTLSTVFPVVFSMIALLGIISTMTRLVMKQRTLIGTLKALGFPRSVVMVHYVSYSMVIALLGCILGAIAGWYTLGVNIYEVMKEYYSNPYERMELSQVSFIVMALITVMAGLTNYFACRKLLVQRASDILRPEPPTVMGAGLLEKTPGWNMLSFASRWNLRDINRNRLRTVAGFIGVTLCSALLVVAFGANELFNTASQWEYNELTPAEFSVGFTENTDYSTVYDYAQMYHGQMVEQKQAEVFGNGNSRVYNVYIVDEGNLFHFQDPNGDFVKLPEYGIAMSSKAAGVLDVKMNDNVSFRMPGDNREYKGRVKLIYKSPGEQGITLKRSFFESQQGEFQPSILYTNMTVPGSYVTDREEVASVFSKEEYITALLARRASMDSTVLYVMVIAVVIGIVVTYNLGVLAFVEKTREIATLKVLGFPTSKIRWILQQQNILISGLGTLTGLLSGSSLLVEMMAQIDPDADYIFPKLSIFPYLISFMLSFGLSLIVNAVISSKVKDINMVEALKGVE